jgi:RNA polymerase sigma-70 factor (ECF subfamily)
MRGWRQGRQPGDDESPGRDPGDSELVLAAQHDRRAFAPLYKRHQDDLLRYCFYCLGDWDEAADATQQVFANALAKLPGFVDHGGGPQGTFKPWLFTIAHNEVCARQQRRNRRREGPLSEDDEFEDPNPTPEDLAIATDDHQQLRALLAHLSPGRRRVCELRLADLTDREIAGVLGMTEGAVRTAQSRAVEQLRGLMGVTATRKGGRDA